MDAISLPFGIFDASPLRLVHPVPPGSGILAQKQGFPGPYPLGPALVFAATKGL